VPGASETRVESRSDAWQSAENDRELTQLEELGHIRKWAKVLRNQQRCCGFEYVACAGQAAAVRSAERALQVATDRYRAGAVSYLEVVTAQSTALANERTAADISRRQLEASVRLIKAVGGQWTGGTG